MLVFWQTSTLDRGVRHEEEAVFGRADRRRVEANGADHDGGGHYPAGGHFGADVLTLEEAVRSTIPGVDIRRSGKSVPWSLNVLMRA